jgi:hypothetical protein
VSCCQPDGSAPPRAVTRQGIDVSGLQRLPQQKPASSVAGPTEWIGNENAADGRPYRVAVGM